MDKEWGWIRMYGKMSVIIGSLSQQESRLHEFLGKNLGTVDASVCCLLWLHKQSVVEFAVEVTFPLNSAIILASYKKKHHNFS